MAIYLRRNGRRAASSRRQAASAATIDAEQVLARESRTVPDDKLMPGNTLITAPVWACSPHVPAFSAGGEFTVGAEEELLLVGRDGHVLGDAAAPLREALTQGVPASGLVTGEVFLDQIELGSPVCHDGEGVAESLRELRGWLAVHGAVTMAAGVHPDAAFGAVCTASSPRYELIAAEFAGLFRTPTSALQVHVGLPDSGTAMLAYRGLRNRLSVLRALAAASPYWHGQDSGLASARAAIMRSYPRVSVPPRLRSWEEYVEATQRLVSAAQLPDYTYVWWDLRPQPRLGTVEVRVMDAQYSLARAAGLTALVQGMAMHAVDAPDLDDLPDDVVAANDFRACRYGMDSAIVDVDGAFRSVRDVAERVVADARSMLAPQGLDRPLEAVESMLAGPAEPARQRDVCQRQGMPALLADLVTRTSANG